MQRNPFQSTQQTHLFSDNKTSKTFIAHQLTIQSLIKDLFKKKSLIKGKIKDKPTTFTGILGVP